MPANFSSTNTMFGGIGSNYRDQTGIFSPENQAARMKEVAARAKAYEDKQARGIAAGKAAQAAENERLSALQIPNAAEYWGDTQASLGWVNPYPKRPGTQQGVYERFDYTVPGSGIAGGGNFALAFDRAFSSQWKKPIPGLSDMQQRLLGGNSFLSAEKMAELGAPPEGLAAAKFNQALEDQKTLHRTYTTNKEYLQAFEAIGIDPKSITSPEALAAISPEAKAAVFDLVQRQLQFKNQRAKPFGFGDALGIGLTVASVLVPGLKPWMAATLAASGSAAGGGNLKDIALAGGLAGVANFAGGKLGEWWDKYRAGQGAATASNVAALGLDSAKLASSLYTPVSTAVGTGAQLGGTAAQFGGTAALGLGGLQGATALGIGGLSSSAIQAANAAATSSALGINAAKVFGALPATGRSVLASLSPEIAPGITQGGRLASFYDPSASAIRGTTAGANAFSSGSGYLGRNLVHSGLSSVANSLLAPPKGGGGGGGGLANQLPRVPTITYPDYAPKSVGAPTQVGFERTSNIGVPSKYGYVPTGLTPDTALPYGSGLDPYAPTTEPDFDVSPYFFHRGGGVVNVGSGARPTDQESFYKTYESGLEQYSDNLGEGVGLTYDRIEGTDIPPQSRLQVFETPPMGVGSLNDTARNMTRYAYGGGVGSLNETARAMTYADGGRVWQPFKVKIKNQSIFGEFMGYTKTGKVRVLDEDGVERLYPKSQVKREYSDEPLPVEGDFRTNLQGIPETVDRYSRLDAREEGKFDDWRDTGGNDRFGGSVIYPTANLTDLRINDGWGASGRVGVGFGRRGANTIDVGANIDRTGVNFRDLEARLRFGDVSAKVSLPGRLDDPRQFRGAVDVPVGPGRVELTGDFPLKDFGEPNVGVAYRQRFAVGGPIIKTAAEILKRDPAGFFNKSQHVIQKATLPSATGKKWQQLFQDKGINKAELGGLGLLTFLNLPRDEPITKEAVADFIDENRLTVGEDYRRIAPPTGADEKIAFVATDTPTFRDLNLSWPDDVGDRDLNLSWPRDSSTGFSVVIEPEDSSQTRDAPRPTNFRVINLDPEKGNDSTAWRIIDDTGRRHLPRMDTSLNEIKVRLTSMLRDDGEIQTDYKAPRWAQWILESPGGGASNLNYREIALTDQQTGGLHKSTLEFINKLPEQDPVAAFDPITESQTQPRQHDFPENTLVHIRVTDRPISINGVDHENVLYSEEFQSDWAQGAIHKGIRRPEDISRKSELLGKLSEARLKYNALELHYSGYTSADYRSSRSIARQELIPIENELEAIDLKQAYSPFLESGDKKGSIDQSPVISLAINRVLREAVDNGQDYVVFSNYNDQVTRWGETNLKPLYQETIPNLAKKIVKNLGGYVKPKFKTKEKESKYYEQNPDKAGKEGEAFFAATVIEPLDPKTGIAWDTERDTETALLEGTLSAYPHLSGTRFVVHITDAMAKKIREEGQPVLSRAVGGPIIKGAVKTLTKPKKTPSLPSETLMATRPVEPLVPRRLREGPVKDNSYQFWPVTEDGERPEKLYRVMSEEEYSAGMKADSFNTTEGVLWHASAEPLLQYRASDQGVLVEIDYSDAQDWNAKMALSGEVEATTWEPVPASKVKRIDFEKAKKAPLLPSETLMATRPVKPLVDHTESANIGELGFILRGEKTLETIGIPGSSSEKFGIPVPRYMYHSLRGPQQSSGGITAYPISKKGEREILQDYKGGHPEDKVVWLGQESWGLPEETVRIDLSKLDISQLRATGQVEGNVVYRGDIPESAIVPLGEASRTQQAKEMVSSLLPSKQQLLETPLDDWIELGINEEFPFIGENLEKWGYLGDRAALNKALADPQYEEYRDVAQSLARSHLGDEFKVYRIEGLYGTGEVEDIVSATFNKRAKETGERLGREVLEATITPSDVIAFGQTGEAEILVRRGVFSLTPKVKKRGGGPIMSSMPRGITEIPRPTGRGPLYVPHGTLPMQAGGGVSSLNEIARNMTRYAYGGGVGSMNETARLMFV